ncbi:cleavage and polyadenylation specificity factor subunit 7-like isoform X1 [Scleropages formosus]|uniref:Cleavage and polyadenylation specific factor 7 n=1 Tax=Scleropages formosus TaxID=113540 RepID=A0A8C9RNT5_SCLFO|nr:cleavage and polyadenylation specificity factor subunit 7 isoform X1 [Scleropages formosus]XP_018619407.2 cleavage and polyadenylation specificity factor subunit 7 isoform X1 [Scleropages formosus]
MATTGGVSAPDATDSELIDIYGEDVKESSEQDGEFEERLESTDLYDDVLTGSVNLDGLSGSDPSKARAPKSESKPAILYTYSGGRSKKLAVYVGNFSWWTTDTDLINLARRIGVKDIEEIKFAENRANGQSRGYAEVVVSSEASLQRLLDSLPQCHVNGEKVDCRFATRHNFSLFEAQAKKRVPQRSNSRESSDFGDGRPPASSLEHHNPSVPHIHPPHPHPNKPSLPTHFYARPPHFGADAPSIFSFPPPHIPPPPLPQIYPPTAPHLPSQPAPTLHLNPAFFPASQESFANAAYGHSVRESDMSSSPLPDGDSEELMSRNRAIASGAITKAVSGAAAGDFPTAIETLLTAIAVIKQSRVSGDECCRALVTSLKDCLFSIDRKSCGSRKRHHDRERDRETPHNQAWEVGEGSWRHRDRSTSREREHPRERERDRHRDYREHHH